MSGAQTKVGSESRPAHEPALARAKPWDEAEALAREKDVLGFYVSSHPLDRFAGDIERFANTHSQSVKGVAQDSRVIIGGLIKSVRPIVTKTGGRMSIVTLEDRAGAVECVLFTEAYAAHADKLIVDAIVFLVGTADHSRGDPQLIVEQVIPIHEAAPRLATRMEIVIDESALNGAARAAMEQVAGEIRRAQGMTSAASTGFIQVPVQLVVRSAGKRYRLEAPSSRVCPTGELVSHLRHVLGEHGVAVHGGKPIEPNARKERGFRRVSAPVAPAVGSVVM